MRVCVSRLGVYGGVCAVGNFYASLLAVKFSSRAKVTPSVYVFRKKKVEFREGE